MHFAWPFLYIHQRTNDGVPGQDGVRSARKVSRRSLLLTPPGEIVRLLRLRDLLRYQLIDDPEGEGEIGRLHEVGLRRV